MLLAGAWESATDYSSRVWFTPRLGTDEGDDERIPNSVDHQNYIDLDEKDGTSLTRYRMRMRPAAEPLLAALRTHMAD
jgi:hypothetical protein